MVLDVCPPLPAPTEVVSEAVERTARWARRGRGRFLQRTEDLEGERAQFGIVQGGLDVELRRRCAEELLEIGFDGYAIGGLSVGEERPEMLAPLVACNEVLPFDRPRYFMGLGDPAGLMDAIGAGVDMFDCVWPTRMARHGTALTREGRLNIGAARYANSDDPLDPDFPASPASRWSRGYIRHLLSVREPAAARILTLHNLAWMFDLMRRARAAIEAGSVRRLAQRGDRGLGVMGDVRSQAAMNAVCAPSAVAFLRLSAASADPPTHPVPCNSSCSQLSLFSCTCC